MDWSKVYLLMEIATKSGGFPKLGKIHRAAMEALQEINDEDEPKARAPRDVTPPAGPANADTKLPSGEIVQKPQTPVLPDGRADTTGDKRIPVDSLARNPDGTIRTVKVDPLENKVATDNQKAVADIDKPAEPVVERRV